MLPVTGGQGVTDNTFGGMKGAVQNWMRETIDDALRSDAVNDAIENLGNSILLASLARMVKGPVQNVTFNAGDERQTIVIIPDPTVNPVMSILVAAGGSAPVPRTVYGCYTYMTESGSETNISPVVSIAVVDPGDLAQMAAPAQVNEAYGWNCYMSLDNVTFYRQNTAPMLFSQSALENSGGANAATPVYPPTSNDTADNITYIDALEVQNSDGTWTRWRGAELWGLMMQRATSQIAANSSYVVYCWDIVNERQIELRPKAAMTLNPRYFYVSKPRRLLYDNSLIPFRSFAGTIAFIRYFALSLVSLTVHEYDASARWENKANAERQMITLVANDQNAARVSRITPYLY